MTPTLEAFLEAMGMELAPIPPEFQKHLNEHFLELVETSNAAGLINGEAETPNSTASANRSRSEITVPSAPLPAEAVSELCL